MQKQFPIYAFPVLTPNRTLRLLQLIDSHMNLHLLLKSTFTLLILLLSTQSYAQKDTLKVKLFVVTTNDGGEFIGEIISEDAKDLIIKTKDKGEVSIPKYQIKERKALESSDLNQFGEYIPAEVFSTRYFLTTNGLPIEKGESYVQWNLWGPDFELGVAKNFSVGLMTTWLANPVIANAKYCIPLNKKTSLGVGTLIGTTTWFYSGGLGLALPYASLTSGDRKSNISFSAGYGAVMFDEEASGRMLLSGAGMTKVGKKVSLVFDSFILPGNFNANTSTTALIIPGIRVQTAKDKAFQFGFAGIYADSEFVPLPIPFVQWYKKL